MLVFMGASAKEAGFTAFLKSKFSSVWKMFLHIEKIQHFDDEGTVFTKT